MPDAAENISSWTDASQEAELFSNEPEWQHCYGPFAYYEYAQDQACVRIPSGTVSGRYKPSLDPQSEDVTTRRSERIRSILATLLEAAEQKEICSSILTKLKGGLLSKHFDQWASFADEELTWSCEVEAQVDSGDVDTVGEELSQWTSDQLLGGILDPQSESDMPRLREMILLAEDTGITREQSALLAPWLLRFAERNRNSDDLQDAVVVWSAIRTGASMLTPDKANQLLPLLEPGHAIETSLVAVKMLGRIFEAQPPSDVDCYPALAHEVRAILDSLLNRYAIATSQSAAMAQLAIYALAAMACSEIRKVVETVRDLGVKWFTRRAGRDLRDLLQIWSNRPVPAGHKPRELLECALQALTAG